MFKALENSILAQPNPELRAPSQQVFYHELVDWDHIDALTFQAEPVEQLQVRQTILEILDHVVIMTVLERLPKAHYDDFLEMCRTQFADPAVMEWLRGHVEDISTHIEAELKKTKTELQTLVVVV